MACIFPDIGYNGQIRKLRKEGLFPCAIAAKKKKEKFYITTPIYYPSDKLHIGHTYCTVATDAMARYKRLRGYDVMFLTGTDEHGQKIENRAKEAGITPKQFVDQIVEGERGVLDLWKLMNISYDRFIRTTDEYHVKAIQRIFKKMYENGDIYKGKYTGMYCTPCESFWTESQLKDGKCPDCGREVQPAEEEAYFFRLSKYAQPVRDLLMNTDYLQPRSRVNEMVRNFIDPGLEDPCVSRTSFTWGIPVDFDPGHVVYVWVDALFNYTTALGFLEENDAHHDYDRYWPADVHFVGKEIVRFHSISLARHAHEHGHALCRRRSSATAGCCWNGGKMSKSKGNVVDPLCLLAERFGMDALRFFPAAHVPVRLRTATSPTSCSSPASTLTSPTTWKPRLAHDGHGAEVLRRQAPGGAARRRRTGRRPCGSWPVPCMSAMPRRWRSLPSRTR